MAGLFGANQAPATTGGAPAAFLWGDGGQQLTPAQVAAQQQMAYGLMAQQKAPQNVGEGLDAVGTALLARSQLGRANDAQAAGRKQADADMSGLMTDPTKAMAFIANDQFASEGQKAVANAMLQQQMMLTNPDMIAQRALMSAQTQKAVAEANMMQGGGTAVGTPIQDANGNYYVPTQYGGTLRPLSPPGAIPTPEAASAPPTGGSVVTPPLVDTTPVPAAPTAPLQPTAAPVGGGAPTTPSGTPFLTPSQQAGQKTLAEKNATIQSELPRQMVAAKTALDQLDQSDSLVQGFIDQAISQAGGLSTGWIGKLSEQVPSSPAYKLAKTLDTVKANIGFDKLAAMRAASPSGGALGQVSNMEEQLLQSVQGSLDQGQDPQTIVANLQRMKGFIAGNSQQRKAAYAADFGGVKPLSGDPSFNSITPPTSDAPTFNVPDGTHVKDPSGKLFVIKGGQPQPVT